MKITLTVPFGEMNLELPAEKVVSLVESALQYACGIEQKTVPPAAQKPETAPPAVPEPHGTSKTVKKTMSRVERMFGDFRTSRAAEPKAAETYRGFLMVQCESCGKVKGFCANVPISEYTCECGQVTQLHDLRPVHLECKCGSEFTYRTNITGKRFDFPCLHCGSPVDLALNKRGTAYVTFS